jgi:hypothetical protein
MNNRGPFKFLLVLAIMVTAPLTTQARVTNNLVTFNEDVISQWNRVLKETVSTPGLHPATIMPVRSYAMMHPAMFTRTADQTLVARLWANVNTPTNFLLVWNNVARTVALEKDLTTIEKARLFALTNISLHDALQTAFASKFVYGFWRPVTAIRRADEDGNDNTTADPAWLPLITTPPYPSYAGNMATIGTQVID